MLPNDLLLEVIIFLDIDDISNLFLINKTTYELSSCKQSLVIKRLYIPWKLKRMRRVIEYKRLSYIQKIYPELIIKEPYENNILKELFSELFDRSIKNDDVDICKFIIKLIKFNEIVLTKCKDTDNYNYYERYLITAIENNSINTIKYFISLTSNNNITHLTYLNIYCAFLNPVIIFISVEKNRSEIMKLLIKKYNILGNIASLGSMTIINLLTNCLVNDHREMFKILYTNFKKNMLDADIEFIKSACENINVSFNNLL